MTPHNESYSSFSFVHEECFHSILSLCFTAWEGTLTAVPPLAQFLVALHRIAHNIQGQHNYLLTALH